MQAICTERPDFPRETVGFAVARLLPGAPSPARYVQSVHTQPDGTIVALAYAGRDGACIFTHQQAAQHLAARLAANRVFAAQTHVVEPLAGSSGA